MVQLIAFFKRRADMTPEAFQQRWSSAHAALVAKLPGLRRYVQCHALLSIYPKREPPWDGVAVASFDDTQTMRDLAPGPEYAAVRADEARFIDPASMGSIIVEPRVVVDGPAPPDGVVQISLLRRREGMPVEGFQKYWRDTHGPLGARLPGLRRYVQCPTRLSIYAAGRTPAYDGAALTWFDDTAAMRASAASAEYARTRADEIRFLDSSPIPFVIARERVIVA